MDSPQVHVCKRCNQPVAEAAFDYEVMEGMHYVCFHYEFEHEGDVDIECGAGQCPSRTVRPRPNRRPDAHSPPDSWKGWSSLITNDPDHDFDLIAEFSYKDRDMGRIEKNNNANEVRLTVWERTPAPIPWEWLCGVVDDYVKPIADYGEKRGDVLRTLARFEGIQLKASGNLELVSAADVPRIVEQCRRRGILVLGYDGFRETTNGTQATDFIADFSALAKKPRKEGVAQSCDSALEVLKKAPQPDLWFDLVLDPPTF